MTIMRRKCFALLIVTFVGVNEIKTDDERFIERLMTWCPECQAKLKIKISYPFRDWTMRIDIDCNDYDPDTGWRCDWSGIYLELKS